MGETVEWNTSYRQDGKIYSYKIKGSAQTLDDFEISDPFESESSVVGTEVIIYNLKRDFRSLRDESAPRELAKKFAAYLTEYPNLRLEYNGVAVDPAIAQNHQKSYPLGDISLTGGRRATVEVSVIEWNISTERVLHLCDAKGISLNEIPVGQTIRAPGFNFTAYIKSEFFREMDSIGQLCLPDLDPDVQIILTVVGNKIKEQFRRRSLEKQGRLSTGREKEHMLILTSDKPHHDPVKTRRATGFDILAANVRRYHAVFEDRVL